MKILFYSERCKFSSELIKKLKETNFSKEFQLIDIDNNQVPSKIKVVPTIIDPEYKDLLEGKKAFEYIFNKKYFDNPTNNLYLWKDKIVPKPDIKEDKLANNTSSYASTQSKESNDHSKYFSLNEKNNDIKEDSTPTPPKKQIRISNRSLLRIKSRR
tara:strand:- start:824 stop:1294 length:471 start_codon:yes stop_codon:yes gene_type:complete